MRFLVKVIALAETLERESANRARIHILDETNYEVGTAFGVARSSPLGTVLGPIVPSPIPKFPFGLYG